MSFGLCLLIALVGVQETLVERVVAVVGDQVITLTEVEEAARVIWIAQGGNSKSVDSVPASVRDTVLDYLIDQAVISQFVLRYGFEPSTKTQRDGYLRPFLDKFESRDAFEAFMRRFQIDEDDVISCSKDRLEMRLSLESGEVTPIGCRQFGGFECFAECHGRRFPRNESAARYDALK